MQSLENIKINNLKEIEKQKNRQNDISKLIKEEDFRNLKNKDINVPSYVVSRKADKINDETPKNVLILTNSIRKYASS